MKFKIHFEYDGHDPDFIILSGDIIEDIQKEASIELLKRRPINYWSEEIADE